MSKPSRREQLLQLANAMWLAHGYAGFSFADLSKATGIRKASVHYHFETKEALISALIEHHTTRFETFAQHTAHTPAPRVMQMFFGIYTALLDEPNQLCAAGTMCADLTQLPPDVAVAAAAYLRGQEGWLAALIERGPWQVHSVDLALTILSALQGSLQRARAGGESTPLEATIRTLNSLLAMSEA